MPPKPKTTAAEKKKAPVKKTSPSKAASKTTAKNPASTSSKPVEETKVETKAPEVKKQTGRYKLHIIT